MSDLRDCIERSLLLGANVGGLFYGSSMLLVLGFFQQLNTTWLRHSAVLTYADDTSTSVTGKTIEEVIQKLEEDAKRVLSVITLYQQQQSRHLYNIFCECPHSFQSRAFFLPSLSVTGREGTL